MESVYSETTALYAISHCKQTNCCKRAINDRMQHKKNMSYPGRKHTRSDGIVIALKAFVVQWGRIGRKAVKPTSKFFLGSSINFLPSNEIEKLTLKRSHSTLAFGTIFLFMYLARLDDGQRFL